METVLGESMSNRVENIPDSGCIRVVVKKSSDIFRNVISLVQDSSQV